MARQENTVAVEQKSSGLRRFTNSYLSILSIKFDWTFTCEVPNCLQFEGLQDCFEGGHLEVHLLADLHIVMFQVSFLVTSLCNPNNGQKQPVSEVFRSQSRNCDIFKNAFTFCWNSVVASISFFSCSVN